MTQASKIALVLSLAFLSLVCSSGPAMNPNDIKKQVEAAEALVKAEWRKIKEPAGPPGQFVGWSPAVSPALPAAWPPDGKGQIHYYAYAYGFRPSLSDAQVVGAPWARVTVDATGRASPRLGILTRKVKEIGIQGVRPLRTDEIPVAKSYDAVEAELYKLSRQTSLANIDTSAIKRYFRHWCDTNGTMAEQIRPLHKAFFDWVGCK